MNLSNSVFISYRRNVSGTLALAVYQDLTNHDIDVFHDITRLDAGQFENDILHHIAARPYFLPILTPGTLERCTEPSDMMLREIQEALRLNRMIVLLYTPRFKFDDIEKYLPSDVAQELRSYNGMRVPYTNKTMDYFTSSMLRLRTDFLKPIDRPITPTPISDVPAIERKRALAGEQPPVGAKQLSAQEYFESAYDKHENGDYEGAIADLAEAIVLNPQFAEAYYNRGVARANRSDGDGAIADFNQAIALNPRFAEAYYNRGVTHHNTGRIHNAIADYSRAISIDVQYANAYQSRALARHTNGDLNRAIEDYSRAISLRPLNAEAYGNRGWAYGNKGDLDAALADLSQAIALNPEHISAYANRALIYEKKGEMKKAAADYRRVLELRPDHPQAKDMRRFIKKHG